MRSRTERARVVAAGGRLSVALSAGAAHARQDAARAAGGAAAIAAEIARALETVKADPNLGHRAHDQDAALEDSRPQTKPSARPAWLDMDRRAVSAGSSSRRALLVCGVAARRAGRTAGRLHRPHRRARVGVSRDEARSSRRRTCGISTSGRRAFPTDIGAAARALWDRGEHRAALALLYRGMLSRLAHVHRVPIRDSSTEGDCLALAARHLAHGRREYASRLVSRVAAVRVRRPGHSSRRPCTCCATTSRQRSIGRRARDAESPEAPHDARAHHLRCSSASSLVGARRLGREQHVLGGHQGADAAEGRGAHQSVLCRAAIRRGARRSRPRGIACSPCRRPTR